MPVTTRFRLAVGGLAETDGATLRQMLADGALNAAPQWDVVDREYDALVVDPDADDAAAMMGGRPFGSLVILALRPGETAWPGTLALARPFDSRQVDLALNLAAQIVAQPAFAAQRAPVVPTPSDPATSAELENSVEASAADAPLFVEAVEEAAAIEESQAIEQEAQEDAEQADADAHQMHTSAIDPADATGQEPESPALESMALAGADEPEGTDEQDATTGGATDPFEGPVLTGSPDDDAIDRLAMVVLEPAGDDGDADAGDQAGHPAAAGDPVVELAHDLGEPIDLMTFAAGDDPASEFGFGTELESAREPEPERAANADAEPEADAGIPGESEIDIPLFVSPIDAAMAASPRTGEPEDAGAGGESAGQTAAIDPAETDADWDPFGPIEPAAPAASSPTTETTVTMASTEPVRAAGRDRTAGASPEHHVHPPPAPATATTLAEEMPAPTVALEDVDSLLTLATAYREQLYRGRHVVVRVEGHAFHLEPYSGECYADSSPEGLGAYRGRDGLEVAIAQRDEPAAGRPATSVGLVEFLWHLGQHAGNAELLPWVDREARYRITRTPPLGDDARDTGMLQIAQLLARSPVAPADIAGLAGAPDEAVADFLNGCSLVGYLERVATPVRRGPRANGRPPEPEQPASLIGSLRRRIGLSD